MGDYLTPEELADMFRVTPQTVLNWIRARRIEGLYLSPRVVRIPRTEVERLRQARRPVPDELLESRPWYDVLAEYERHFGTTTNAMLLLRAEKKTPELSTVDDERLYDAWLGAAELAIAAGLLEKPRVAAAV